jgi:hypothetical protein
MESDEIAIPTFRKLSREVDAGLEFFDLIYYIVYTTSVEKFLSFSSSFEGVVFCVLSGFIPLESLYCPRQILLLNL